METLISPEIAQISSQPHALHFLKATYILETPLWKFTVSIGNVRNKEEKNYKRILSGCLAALLTPPSIFGASAALISRWVTFYLQHGGFIYCKGREDEIVLKNPKKFSLFTLNACCFSGGLPKFFGGVSPSEERIDQIAEKILAQDPDVICLQEMADEKSSLRLVELLAGSYRDMYLNIGPRRLIKGGSGLFVASKYPIEEPHFEQFIASTNAQKFEKKGFFNFFITNQGKRFAQIANTHLQPSKNELYPSVSEIRVRESQISQILQKMKCEDLPRFAVGDLNLVVDSEEYEFSSIRSFVDLSEKIKEGTWINYDSLNKTRQKIDYMLFKGVEINHTTKLIPFFDPTSSKKALSDHQGLFAQINVS